MMGRDNTTPVLHYTLAWHKADKPSTEHMQQHGPIETLKVMGLAEHQAVHCRPPPTRSTCTSMVVVNTVHPETGRTAPLKFTKERLSRMGGGLRARARHPLRATHPQQCRTERHTKSTQARPTDLLMGRKREVSKMLMAAPEKRPARKPYVPVKDKFVGRKQWLDKKEITDRMRAMRATLDAQLKSDRDATWARHQKGATLSIPAPTRRSNRHARA